MCDHPKRRQIEARIVGEQYSYEELGAIYDVTTSSLSRHKQNHLEDFQARRSAEERNRAEAILRRKEVRESLQRTTEAVGQEDLSKEQVVHILELLITADMGHFMQWDADGKITLTPSDELGDLAKAIKTFKKVGDQVVPVLHDKAPLLRLLGANLGLVTDRETREIRIVHTTPDGEEQMTLPPVKVVRELDEGSGQ